MDAKFICTFVVLCFGISVTLGQACVDKVSFCNGWPDSYCQSYKDYMKENCAKKCGYCTTGPTAGPDGACSDKAQYCDGWKNSGYCAVDHKYHQYMKDNCKKTCGFCGTQPGTTKPPVTNPTQPSGSCSASSKIAGCSFDSHSCDFVDVPFDDDHDFALKSSGGHDNKGYMSSSGRGKADLILPLELLVTHNGDHGNMCMEFYYRISSGGTLDVYAVKNAKNYPKEAKLSLSSSQGAWKKARISFEASQRYHLMLRATPNSGNVDIDNVRFCDRCN